MNTKGQSIIEYALIIVLVVLGVVTMGPYLLRSINAHFKLWDDSVSDSFSEKIQQAPVDHVPDLPLDCNCPVSKGSCGSAVSACTASQREMDYNCNPQGCNGAQGASYCVDDPSCCTDWVPIGCGKHPLPTDPSTGLVNTALETTNATPPQAPADRSCYYGQEIEVQRCGSNQATLCVDNRCPTNTPPNGFCCQPPACLGIPQNAEPCPNNVPFNGQSLNTDTTLSYAPNIASCNPQIACQYYCPVGFFLNNTKTACINCNTNPPHWSAWAMYDPANNPAYANDTGYNGYSGTALCNAGFSNLCGSNDSWDILRRTCTTPNTNCPCPSTCGAFPSPRLLNVANGNPRGNVGYERHNNGNEEYLFMMSGGNGYNWNFRTTLANLACPSDGSFTCYGPFNFTTPISACYLPNATTPSSCGLAIQPGDPCPFPPKGTHKTLS